MSLLLTHRALYSASVLDAILITVTPTASFTVGFNLTFTGSVFIDFKDGGGKEALTSGVEKTHLYSVGGAYIIEITGDFNNITRFEADTSRITEGEFHKLPLLNRLRLQNNLLTGNVLLPPMSGQLWLYGNTSMTQFTPYATGNGTLTDVRIYSTGLVGVMDLTKYLFNGAFLWLNANSLMTSVNFALTGNGSAANTRLNSVGIIGAIDFKDLNLGGFITTDLSAGVTGLVIPLSGNNALTDSQSNQSSIPFIDFTVFPTSTPIIDRQNNGMTSTQTDNQIINIDSTGWINGTLQIIAGNGLRTAASDAAYNNLILNGWTIT